MPMPDSSVPLKIGTRGSPLALAQADETCRLLMAAHGLDRDSFEIVVIKTTADRVQDRMLKDIGGKGLFTKEIEEALLSQQIDAAIHCVKDMGNDQPEGLVIDGYMEREDVRDGFVSNDYATLADVPVGQLIGTASVRRRAQVLARRPDLDTVMFRGNVQARLRKLNEGQAAATYLAMAGLNRLRMQNVRVTPVSVDDMMPAIGQGALAIQRRADDLRTAALFAPLHHRNTTIQMAAERRFLATLDGSCQTPIAGYAELLGDRLRMRGEILRTDGREVLTTEGECACSDAAELGHHLARELLERAPAGFFAHLGGRG